MPPKPKLHKQTGKSLKSIPKVVSNSSAAPNQVSTVNNANSLAEPSTSNEPPLINNEQQFESELCWCIQQLQNGLKSQKLNNKQVQDHSKALNILMSNTTPLVQKRQVMRLSFGDYRAKMQAEERKASKKISMKVGPAKPSQKSMFLKKAFSTTSGKEFKFNFPAPEESEPNGLSENMDQLNIVNNSSKTENLVSVRSPTISTKENNVFEFSDNSFRFNFSNNE